MEENRRVLVAMSGGVDSSAAVWLLQAQGYECVGVTMELFGGQPGDVEDARAAAERMGIAHHVLNCAEQFRRQVVQPFVDAYQRGETPNPCVFCNRALKFGLLLDKADELGCAYLATGHYARIIDRGGQPRLCKAADPGRDQSYVLYPIPRERLGRVLFPLGELSKEQARAIAAQAGFANAGKRDSQDICFIPDGDYLSFLERYTGRPSPAGNIVNLEGRVVGRHRGAAGLTIGQRRGVGVSSGGRIYVCGKCMETNTVTVGPEEELYSRYCAVQEWNWLVEPSGGPFEALAKTRYRQREQRATVCPEDGGARLEFARPQRAVTPGQSAVVYDEAGAVLGGGIITSAWG